MDLILDYVTDGALTLLVSLPIYLLLRRLWVQYTGQKRSRRREIWLAVFWLFLIWLASETVLPEFSLFMDTTGRLRFQFGAPFHMSAAERLRTGQMMNFVPFDTIRRYTSFRYFGISAVNLIGNVIMFVPFGFLLPLLWKKLQRFWLVGCIGAGGSCFIECVQLFIDRSVDIDDVILNTAGVVLGYFLLWTWIRMFPNVRRWAK